MERIKTGIRGFDKLVQGGIPRGSSTLLSGTPGTGKTIFGIEFVYRGAEDFREPSLYIAFEEGIDNLLNQAEQLNMDLNKFVERGQIVFFSIPAEEITNNTINEIIGLIEKHRIKRLVIDSLSTLAINFPYAKENVDAAKSRFIYTFLNKIKKSGVTSIFISHTSDEKSLSKDSISEFLCDGIVHLTFESMGGEFSRSLIVRKMRRTKNDEDIHPLEISPKGLVVHSIK